MLSIDEQNKLIADECDKLKELLLRKNIQYGGTALCPLKISSNLSTLDKINVRIEDKIGRLIHGDKTGEDEDPYWDLAGYIILRSIARRVFPSGNDLEEEHIDLMISDSFKPEKAPTKGALDISKMTQGELLDTLTNPFKKDE